MPEIVQPVTFAVQLSTLIALVPAEALFEMLLLIRQFDTVEGPRKYNAGERSALLLLTVTSSITSVPKENTVPQTDALILVLDLVLPDISPPVIVSAPVAILFFIIAISQLLSVI